MKHSDENAVPRKHKGLRIAGITVGSAAVVCAGAFGVYHFSPYVRNQVKLLVSSPQDYYTWVVEENAGEWGRAAQESYDKYTAKLENGVSDEVKLEYRLGADAVSTLETYLRTELGGEGTDEQVDKLVKRLNEIKAVAVDVHSAVKGPAQSGTVSAQIDGEPVLTMETALNTDPYAVFLRVPELSEKWLGVNITEAFDTAMKGYEMVNGEGTADEMGLPPLPDSDPTAYLTPEELGEMLPRYVKTAALALGDVEMTKKSSENVGNLTLEYTKLTAAVDANEAKGLLTALIDEAANDATLKAIVTERAGACGAEDYTAYFDDAREEIEQTEMEETPFTVAFFVNASGTISGFTLDASDEGEYPTSETVRLLVGADKENVAGEFRTEIVTQDSANSLGLTYSGVYDEGEKWSGDLNFNMQMSAEPESDVTVKCALKDMERVSEENGYYKGTVDVSVKDATPVTLVLESDGVSQKIGYSAVGNGMDMGTLELTFAETDGADITLPAESDAIMYTPDLEEYPGDAYASEEDIQNFIRTFLRKVFGDALTEEEIDEIAEGALYEPAPEDDFTDGLDSDSRDPYYDDSDWTFDDPDQTYDDSDWTFDDPDWTYDDSDWTFDDQGGEAGAQGGFSDEGGAAGSLEGEG